MRLRIILAFHIALIYYTQDFRVYEGTRDQPMPGPFPAPPIFFKGKALGTRLNPPTWIRHCELFEYILLKTRINRRIVNRKLDLSINGYLWGKKICKIRDSIKKQHVENKTLHLHSLEDKPKKGAIILKLASFHIQWKRSGLQRSVTFKQGIRKAFGVWKGLGGWICRYLLKNPGYAPFFKRKIFW